jgi:hypothetical protein
MTAKSLLYLICDDGGFNLRVIKRHNASYDETYSGIYDAESLISHGP